MFIYTQDKIKYDKLHSILHICVYRYMLGISAIPAIIQFLGFLYIPESPRWLISKGLVIDAQSALLSMRKHDCSQEFADILSAFSEEENISSTAATNSNSNSNNSNSNQSYNSRNKTEKKPGVWNFFQNKFLFRALLLGCALQACQQFSGINTIMYYSATILKLAGFSSTWSIW